MVKANARRERSSKVVESESGRSGGALLCDEGPKLAAKCYSGCGVRASALVDAIAMHSSLPFA